MRFEEQEIPDVLYDVSAQARTNYMGIVSFTILAWDHIDTFADEVEYIWKKRWGPVTYLFLVNRYMTPLGFIVNLCAYFSGLWTPEADAKQSCRNFSVYEGVMTMFGISIVEIMMFLRVYVLYNSKRLLLLGVGMILLVQIVMNGWLLTRAQPVKHNPLSGVTACTMIFDPSISVLASSSAWLPLLYDTVVFVLVTYRTLPSVLRRSSLSYTMMRLFEDGLVYYTAICTVTLVLTLMIIFAEPGLKNITAQLELLLTVAMMSRITLNLKKSASIWHMRDPDEQVTMHLTHDLSFHRSFYTSTVDRKSEGTTTFLLPPPLKPGA